ncbi:MAG TPA: hypothetical protein VE221_06510 [Sphingomicrobium sp.]|nr:hypothetical protein [Sphingomicrobium sp.]
MIIAARLFLSASLLAFAAPAVAQAPAAAPTAAAVAAISLNLARIWAWIGLRILAPNERLLTTHVALSVELRALDLDGRTPRAGLFLGLLALGVGSVTV